ncbi:MAG: family 10 glycosylhydrolase [Clostridia bacterium]|nr:family 10 glycosylhydrolase [Clostridia bacterium]
MKNKLNMTMILTILLLIGAIIMSSLLSDSTISDNKTDNSAIHETTNEEMRGMWVSYISLDMQGTNRSFESFKSKFADIISTAESMKCNTLIVHIRPFCDALYDSSIFPPSHVLSGTQGVYCGYDALEYMCKSTHDAGLKIHAWINPYRIASGKTPSALSSDNVFSQSEEICVELESGKYLSPAKKAARKLIKDGVAEIVSNYDVDGIQFDDYFYPADGTNFDYDDYLTYRKSVKNITEVMNFSDWRLSNVNLLIAEVYKTIKAIDNSVLFGISPQGNIENCYSISADVKTWCKAIGYVDYICPQMYYSINHPVVKFEDSLKEWKNLERHGNLKVYIGLGVYKAGTDADSGTWLTESNILSRQLKLLRKYDYHGYMLYDYGAVKGEDAQEELSVFKSTI